MTLYLIMSLLCEQSSVWNLSFEDTSVLCSEIWVTCGKWAFRSRVIGRTRTEESDQVKLLAWCAPWKRLLLDPLSPWIKRLLGVVFEPKKAGYSNKDFTAWFLFIFSHCCKQTVWLCVRELLNCAKNSDRWLIWQRSLLSNFTMVFAKLHFLKCIFNCNKNFMQSSPIKAALCLTCWLTLQHAAQSSVNVTCLSIHVEQNFAQLSSADNDLIMFSSKTLRDHRLCNSFWVFFFFLNTDATFTTFTPKYSLTIVLKKIHYHPLAVLTRLISVHFFISVNQINKNTS